MQVFVSRLVRLALLSAVLAGCGSTPAVRTPATIQPGAPGQATRTLTRDEARQQLPAATAADIAFVRRRVAQKCPDIRLVPRARGRFGVELSADVRLKSA
jgi:hypothetical protein